MEQTRLGEPCICDDDGGDPVLTDGWDHGWCICCKKCGLMTADKNTKSDAIREWNRSRREDQKKREARNT